MAISLIPEAWKSYLRMPTTFRQDGGHRERFYFSFRPTMYPALDQATAAWELNDGSDNQVGSHRLAATGRCSYLLPLDPDDTWTVSLRVKPTCAYTDADKVVWSWANPEATSYLKIGYDAGEFHAVYAVGGGAEVELRGATTFTGDVQLQQWRDLTVSFDLGAGVGRMWLDDAEEDTAWSSAPTALGTYKMPLASLNESQAFNVAFVRLFRAKLATTADVQNRFERWYEEEAYFPLDGHATGWLRCNVTDKVRRYTLTKEAEKEETGYVAANSLRLALNSRQGVFADDQYAPFDPANRLYNGTSSERFLQQRCRMIGESWYGKAFDTFFVGRVTEQLFSRRTLLTGSTVTVEAEDMMADLARAEGPAATYEDKKLSDVAQSNSALHLVTKSATDMRVEQFLANNSFENASIGDSWVVGGAGAALSRVAGGLFGSYHGELVYGSETATHEQVILFTGDRALNVGEKYTYSIWLDLSIASGLVNLKLSEEDSGGANAVATNAATVTGGGWGRYSVSITVAAAASDRLRVKLELLTNATLRLDGAMLHRGLEPVPWFVLNSADGVAGVAGVIGADSMVQSAFETHGFDVDPVNVTHPWLMTDNQLDTAQDLADATMAHVLGYDSAGTLRLRTPMKTGYSDPTPLNTLDSTWDVATEIDEQQTNMVRVAGARFLKDPAAREVYNAYDSKDSDLIFDILDHGDYYPDPSKYPDLWVSYEDIVITTKRTREWWQWHSRKKTIRTRRHDKDEEIVGLQSPTAHAVAYEFGPLYGLGPAASLTQVTFDASSYPDKAKVLWRNETGEIVNTWGFTIRGKLVKRLTGTKGIVHDKFVDHDDIRQNGVQRFEIENDLIVENDQAEKLANYIWKDSHPRKHSYQIPLTGAAGLYLEPGDWQTLRIGGSGENENIDSTVRVMKVVVDRAMDKIGSTKVTLREVQQNFVWNSTAWTRQISSGRYAGGRLDAVVIGASTYMGPADFYCVGSSDEDVLNDAALVAAATGRKLVLSPGTFHIDGTWGIPSGLAVEGAGELTIILSTGSSDIVAFQQNALGISLRMMKLQNGESVNYSKLSVNFNGATRCLLQSCAIAFAAAMGIRCDGDFNKVVDNTCEGGRPGTTVYSELDSEVFNPHTLSGWCDVARLDSTHFVIVFSGVTVGDTYGRAVIGTVAADGSVTFGDQVSWDEVNTGSNLHVAALDATHFMVIFTIGGTDGKAVVGVVADEDEITFGSAYTFSTSTSFQDVSALSSSAAVIVYRENTPFYGKAVVATVANDDEISFGAVATFNAASTNIPVVTAMSATLFVAVYRDSFSEATAIVGTISGTTITFGSEYAFDTTFGFADICKLSDSTFAVGYVRGTSDVCTAVGTVSGTALSFGTVEVVNAGTSANVSVAALDEGHYLISYRDGGNSSYGTLRKVAIIGDALVAGPEWVFVDQAYDTGSMVAMGEGIFAVAYGASASLAGLVDILSVTLSPDALTISGNGNIVQGNHVLGVAGYQQEIGIRVTGDDNSIADNVIDGVVDADKLIDVGIGIVGGSRNAVSGNRVLNCAQAGAVNGGTDTLLDGSNTAFNNGDDTGMETF